jgi:hypothetical protein
MNEEELTVFLAFDRSQKDLSLVSKSFITAVKNLFDSCQKQVSLQKEY